MKRLGKVLVHYAHGQPYVMVLIVIITLINKHSRVITLGPLPTEDAAKLLRYTDKDADRPADTGAVGKNPGLGANRCCH